MAAKRVSRSVPIAAVAAPTGRSRTRQVRRSAWLDPWPDSAVPRAGQSLPARTLQLAKAGLGLPATAGTTL